MTTEQPTTEPPLDNEAFIDCVAAIVRRAGETQDERIADIAVFAVNKLKETDGVFERMLLKCTQQPAPQYHNPMLAAAVNRFGQ